jgi:hypothetical protein
MIYIYYFYALGRINVAINCTWNVWPVGVAKPPDPAAKSIDNLILEGPTAVASIPPVGILGTPKTKPALATVKTVELFHGTGIGSRAGNRLDKSKSKFENVDAPVMSIFHLTLA